MVVSGTKLHQRKGTVILKNSIRLVKDALILHNSLQSLGQTSISTNNIKYQKGYLEDLVKKV